MLDNTLREMMQVSNNSRLTQQVAIALEDKLTQEEIRDFVEWLKIIRSEKQNEIQSFQRKFRNSGGF